MQFTAVARPFEVTYYAADYLPWGQGRAAGSGTRRMAPGQNSSTADAPCQPFAAGWTGALAVGLTTYILVAVLLTIPAAEPDGALDVFNLFSDFPASVITTILAVAAARSSPDQSVRRTWWLMATALGVYSIGNLLNSTYWFFGHDPFPSVGDVFG